MRGEKREQASILRPKVGGDLVSVIIVNFNSLEWLKELLPSLQSQTYKSIEIVIVDNASQDESFTWLETNYPSIQKFRLDTPCGFACAINRGVEIARGEFYLLLNPDVSVEPDAVAQMVSVAKTDLACAAVGAKLMLWWAPAFINGLGNRVGAFSWGTDNGLGHLDLGQFDQCQELPSACFAAALIPKSAWEMVGPTDEGFPMYYEDAEWSYRARLFGLKIMVAPEAVINHAFGGRVPTGVEAGLTPQKLRNVVYGRLRFALKILDGYLSRFLISYFFEDLTHLFRAIVKLDWSSTGAYFGGWSRFLREIPGIWNERKSLQVRRTIHDRDLFALQQNLPGTLTWHGLPELTWDLVQQHYLPLIQSRSTRSIPEFNTFTQRARLLIVSHDVVDKHMAGPGMRYLEIARALSTDLDVSLAVPSKTSLDLKDLEIVRYREDRPESLEMLIENKDVVLISGYLVEKFPFLERTRARLVVDLYDPFVLENLYYYLNEPLEAQGSLNKQAVDITNRLAKAGDFFICGNERQRDYWMGVLTANGRTNPRNFAIDQSLRSLIDVVGMGIPDREPQRNPLLRGIHPQIPGNARIVLWGGGIWNWLDPLTLIGAWPGVISQHPDARLVFLGTRHPNPSVPRHEMAKKAEDLAKEIGEIDRSVIFIEWLSYEERESLLCEADVGVTLHPLHVETRYSLRTRVLDYLWARLPILITEGDITSEWVLQHGIGKVVLPFDKQGVASGLNEILAKPKEEWAPRFQLLYDSLRWPRAVQPLKRYCLEGNYAPDRLDRSVQELSREVYVPASALNRALTIWRTGGTRLLFHRAWRYFQWRFSRL
jgi:GT2 family glycosyltransferase